VAGHFKTFIDQERHKAQHLDPTIKALEGSVLRTGLDYSHTQNEEPGLLDISGNNKTANDPLQALEHLTAYWHPRNGNIDILTTAIAEKLGKVTEYYSIYPEKSRGRVRLVGGAFNMALRKLQTLEPLLEMQHAKRPPETTKTDTIKTDTNVLLMTGDELNGVICFEPIDEPAHPAFRRVIAEQGPDVL
jgi:hypothetical protein